MMPFNEQELNQMPLVDGAIAFMAEVETDFRSEERRVGKEC